MSDKNNKSKKNPSKFKFNMYWVYGAIFLVFVAISLLDNTALTTKKITTNKFYKVLESNDIEKILIINKNVAEIYIKKEALNGEDYKKQVNSPFFNKRSPLFEYNFGDLQNFENKLADYKAKNNLDFDTDSDNRGSLLDSIGYFLPFIILAAIWIFFMRRMSGAGGGGGAGGQIFNIGKSKAKLFDNDTKVKTSFVDVAGLEGAKEEVQEIVDFLKSPEKIHFFRRKIPKGALLVGASRDW